MISIIIPTYNESQNLPPLIELIEKHLQASGCREYEILIMDDDSPDGTAAMVNGWQKAHVRAVNRKGKAKGLSRSVIDGFAEARGEWVGVMDADLSHPPEVLPRLIAALDEGYDLAIGSRYVSGGGITNWPFKRRVTSIVACWLAYPFTRVRDATSGFFFLNKKIIEGVELNPVGFKIGLEICVRAHHQGNWKEVPYVFTDRAAGHSKLKAGVMLDYLRQLTKFVSKSK